MLARCILVACLASLTPALASPLRLVDSAASALPHAKPIAARTKRSPAFTGSATQPTKRKAFILPALELDAPRSIPAIRSPQSDLRQLSENLDSAPSLLTGAPGRR